MKYVITILALGGMVVSILALAVHYSTDTQPCSINEKWDCGIVNHSQYAEIAHIPVAAIGIAGYIAITGLALLGLRFFTFVSAVGGLAFSLYLTHIERDILQVWCVYCVSSLAIISLITVLSLWWVATKPPRQKRTRLRL
jgi:uncharacterized membrane protein